MMSTKCWIAWAGTMLQLYTNIQSHHMQRWIKLSTSSSKHLPYVIFIFFLTCNVSCCRDCSIAPPRYHGEAGTIWICAEWSTRICGAAVHVGIRFSQSTCISRIMMASKDAFMCLLFSNPGDTWQKPRSPSSHSLLWNFLLVCMQSHLLSQSMDTTPWHSTFYEILLMIWTNVLVSRWASSVFFICRVGV